MQAPASNNHGVEPLIVQRRAPATGGIICGLAESAAHRPIQHKARKCIIGEAHGVRGLFLVVPLDVRGHGYGDLQPWEIRRRTLVAIRRAEMPICPSICLARLAGIEAHVHRRKPIKSLRRRNHQSDHVFRQKIVLRPIHFPREVAHSRGCGHYVTGCPTAENAADLPIVAAVHRARRHVVGRAVVPVHGRVIPRRTVLAEHQLLLQVSRQIGALVERVPSRVPCPCGQNQTEEQEICAAVTKVFAWLAPMPGHPRHPHQRRRRPVVRWVVV
mmetsp:Transcript_71951/g.220270  ORF Transcript_71951/g.220270 Transcript_71951/m.220270 type:complete len:272 (-) Transcript_71951:354-1169(-)